MTNATTAEVTIPDHVPQTVDVDEDAQVIRVMLPEGWTVSVMLREEDREMSTEVTRRAVVVRVTERK